MSAKFPRGGGGGAGPFFGLKSIKYWDEILSQAFKCANIRETKIFVKLKYSCKGVAQGL